MCIIFYHINQYMKIVQCMLDAYFETHHIERTYYTIQEDTLVVDLEAKNEDVLLFYCFPERIQHLHKFLSEHTIKAYIIALCQTFNEGIQAVNNGSDYALQLPLSPCKLNHCLEYLGKKTSDVSDI